MKYIQPMSRISEQKREKKQQQQQQRKIATLKMHGTIFVISLHLCVMCVCICWSHLNWTRSHAHFGIKSFAARKKQTLTRERNSMQCTAQRTQVVVK